MEKFISTFQQLVVVYLDWMDLIRSFHVPQGVCISLAVGVITYLSIMQRLILEPSRERRFIRLYSLRAYVSRIELFKSNRGNYSDVLWKENKKVAERIYDETIEHWNKLEEVLSKELFVFKPRCFVMGLIVFGLYLASAFIFPFKVQDYPIQIITFLLAISIFVLLLYFHIEALKMSTKLYPSVGKGKVLIESINDQIYHKGKDEVCYEVLDNAPEIRVKVSFQGKLTNGFFDSRIFLEDGTYFFSPNRITYFNDFIIREHEGKPRLVLTHIFDTGVIQGEWSSKNLCLIFNFPIKIGGKYDHARIPSGVQKIVIGVYEDPAYTLTPTVRGGVPRQSEEVRLPVAFATIKIARGAH